MMQAISAISSQQQSYFNSAYMDVGRPLIDTYGGSTMDILSADIYEDGNRAVRTTSSVGSRLKQQAEHTTASVTEPDMMQIEDVPVRKSKRKSRPESGEDDDEDRKKARGRPRVETKDETAADRRRTQIRIAQRAYRHRKETTISSLEKQVQDLRSTNEQMSSIFISLYEYAMNNSVLQREPDFAKRFKSTAESIQSLAKLAQTEDNDAQQDGNGKSDGESTPKLSIDQTKAQRRRAPKVTQQPLSPVLQEQPAVQTYGGYIVTSEDTPYEEVSLDYQPSEHKRQEDFQVISRSTDNNSALPFGLVDSQQYRVQTSENLDLGYQPTEHRRRGDFQVITRATEDNASFPFDAMDMQQYGSESDQFDDPVPNFFSDSQLSLPTSYSYNELSFSRRLQRIAGERAFKLISTTDPSSDARIREVFGLRLLYESRESIRANILRVLSASAKDTLQDWRSPFVHIGGAGTYYPLHDSDVNGDLMPKFRTGYSMGPFSSAISQAQLTIEDGMRCNVPGFEGEFFDPNDVEGYLRGKGLVISPAADFVTGTLDMLSFQGTPNSKSNSSVTSIVSPRTPLSPVESLLHDTGKGFMQLDMAKASRGALPSSTISQEAATNWYDEMAGSSLLDPAFGHVAGLDVELMTTASARNDNSYSQKREQTVTLSVQVLINELISRAVCLGRAPGFRLSDIDAAILATVRQSTDILAAQDS